MKLLPLVEVGDGPLGQRTADAGPLLHGLVQHFPQLSMARENPSQAPASNQSCMWSAIDRIVRYIDDLDGCPPWTCSSSWSRWPRWLLPCLREQHGLRSEAVRTAAF